MYVLFLSLRIYYVSVFVLQQLLCCGVINISVKVHFVCVYACVCGCACVLTHSEAGRVCGILIAVQCGNVASLAVVVAVSVGAAQPADGWREQNFNPLGRWRHMQQCRNTTQQHNQCPKHCHTHPQTLTLKHTEKRTAEEPE